MSPSQTDVIAYTGCDLVPGVTPWGPGWYLVALNDRVEAGPFASGADAALGAWWLDEHSHGVHPSPWMLRWSGTGLLIGSRIRERTPLDATTPLQLSLDQPTTDHDETRSSCG